MDEMPKGVADHPAREQMEAIWRDGGRAKEIVAWLEAEGLPVLSQRTVGRYGQRYWTEKISIISDSQSPEALDALLNEIEEANLGTVTKIGFTRKKYPGWDKVDGISVPVEKESVSQSIEVVPNREPAFERATIAPINISLRGVEKRSKASGLKLGVVLPDMQIGYHRGTDGDLTTTHDEAAIDVAHQIMAILEAMFGIDLIVNLGDNLDLAGLSRHRSAPGYMGPAMVQLAIDRYGTEVGVQRAIAALAEIWAFNGNHENRLNNELVDKLPALHGISRANERNPVLSIANLCRFDDYNIQTVDTYPDGSFWANDYLKFEHGFTASSTLGGTAAKKLNTSRVSTVYGHIHRQELLFGVVEDTRGGRDIFAGSPGCLARIDGVLPSGQTGIKSSGGQAGTKRERWQHGMFVIWYETEGQQRAWVDPIQIVHGTAVHDGKTITATVTPNGERLDERRT